MELTLRAECWIKFIKCLVKRYAPIITKICFIPFLMSRYNDRLLPLFRQFLLLPNRNNKFTNLQANCSTLCFKQFCRYLIETWLIVTSPHFRPFILLQSIWQTVRDNWKHHRCLDTERYFCNF